MNHLLRPLEETKKEIKNTSSIVNQSNFIPQAQAKVLTRNLLVVALAIWLLALFVRIDGITTDSLQPDEIHWANRSEDMVMRFRTHQYSQITSYIGHPGVPPALIMAFSQVIAEKYNKFFKLKSEDNLYVSQITACRLGITIFSSLIFPFLFLSLAPVFSLQTSFIITLLCVLDPLHVGFSRMTHLDTLLTLFVTMTVVVYAVAEERQSFFLKSLAGCFWGFAIATKPTAVALIPALFSLKLFRKIFQPTINKSIPLISFGDIWAVIFGHLTLALIFTRLWRHQSDYLVKLAIQSSFADAVYSLGQNLQKASYLIVPVIILLILLSLFFLLPSRKIFFSQRKLSILGKVVLMSAFFVSILFFIPQVLENIVRFWTWVFGLSHEKHQAYGEIINPKYYGYPELLIRRLTPVALIGLVLAGIGIILGWSRRKNPEVCRKLIYSCFAFSIIIFWIIPLSISSKQTIRYILPLLPIIYCLAGFGFSAFINYFKVHFKSNLFLNSVLIIYQAFTLVSWSPYYSMYYNPFWGGLEAGIKRGILLPFVGEKQLIDFLPKIISTTTKNKKFILVQGDINLLTFLVHEAQVKLAVQFFGGQSAIGKDYVISSRTFEQRLEDLGDFSAISYRKYPKLFSYFFHGIEMISLYAVPALDYKDPVAIDISKVPHHIGKLKPYKETTASKADNYQNNVLLALPDKDIKGYLEFDTLPFPAGKFVTTFFLGLPKNYLPSIQEDPARYVFKLSVGHHCKRIVHFGELSSDQVKGFDLSCEFTHQVRAQVTTYWFGNVPVILSGIKLRAKE